MMWKPIGLKQNMVRVCRGSYLSNYIIAVSREYCPCHL